MTNLKLGSLNVRGLCNHKFRGKTFQWLKELKLDIVFLQETYCKKDFVSTFNSSWHGKVIHTVTDSCHSRGVCIMFRENLELEILDSKSSDCGRLLLCNVKIKDEVYCLVNVYSPNVETDRKSFFVMINEWIHNYSSNVSNIVLAGDFNCCLLNNDREPQNHLNDTSRKIFNDLIKDLNLCDSISPNVDI